MSSLALLEAEIPSPLYVTGKNYVDIINRPGVAGAVLQGLESSFWGQIGVEFNFQSTGAHYRCDVRISSAHYQLKNHLRSVISDRRPPLTMGCHPMLTENASFVKPMHLEVIF